MWFIRFVGFIGQKELICFIHAATNIIYAKIKMIKCTYCYSNCCQSYTNHRQSYTNHYIRLKPLPLINIFS